MKIFLFTMLVIFLCTGCGDDNNQTENIPRVKVQHVKFNSIQDTEKFSGVVKGRYETDLAFQVGGKIISGDKAKLSKFAAALRGEEN